MQETQETHAQSVGQEDPLEKEVETHSCSCLENPKDREAQWATVQTVTRSQTQLSTHAYCIVNLVTSKADELKKILKEKKNY